MEAGFEVPDEANRRSDLACRSRAWATRRRAAGRRVFPTFEWRESSQRGGACRNFQRTLQEECRRNGQVTKTSDGVEDRSGSANWPYCLSQNSQRCGRGQETSRLNCKAHQERLKRRNRFRCVGATQERGGINALFR